MIDEVVVRGPTVLDTLACLPTDLHLAPQPPPIVREEDL